MKRSDVFRERGWNKIQRLKEVKKAKCRPAPRYKRPGEVDPLWRTHTLLRWQFRIDRAKGYSSRCIPKSVVGVIHYVFGSYGSQAVSVSWCESRHSVNAQNGQYLGLFQMGSWERATYGHGPDALSQSRAAHRYFVASGRDWSPWVCKP